MDISSTVKAVVMPEARSNDIAVPEHMVIFLTTSSSQEAHHVAAVLNSSPVNTVLSGYIVDNHLRIRIFRFSALVSTGADQVLCLPNCLITALTARCDFVMAPFLKTFRYAVGDPPCTLPDAVLVTGFGGVSGTLPRWPSDDADKLLR